MQKLFWHGESFDEPKLQGTIWFEGAEVSFDCQAEIKPDDLYIAERNTGVKLLTCREIGDRCIVPKEVAYSFDTWECAKVIQIDDLTI